MHGRYLMATNAKGPSMEVKPWVCILKQDVCKIVNEPIHEGFQGHSARKLKLVEGERLMHKQDGVWMDFPSLDVRTWGKLFVTNYFLTFEYKDEVCFLLGFHFPLCVTLFQNHAVSLLCGFFP